MQLRFVTVDVFTRRQFGGNPLAVVLNAEGLADHQMQAIAAEFNLSETTFVLPPHDPNHDAQVRIFTPRAELPFAGHPNVGTAFVLSRESRLQGNTRLLFEERAGLVPLDLIHDGEVVTGARLTAPQSLSVGDVVPLDVVCTACGLAEIDVLTKNHPPLTAGCGTPFVFVELASSEALGTARPDAAVFATRLPASLATGVHLYVSDGDHPGRIAARMFAPAHGIAEDPATGSANVALAALLARLSPEPDCTLAFEITQGTQMGRPSLLDARAVKRDGKVIEATIGGHCVEVTRGELTLR